MNLFIIVLELVNGVNFNLLDMLLICLRLVVGLYVICVGLLKGFILFWGYLLKLVIRFISSRFVSEFFICVGGE